MLLAKAAPLWPVLGVCYWGSCCWSVPAAAQETPQPRETRELPETPETPRTSPSTPANVGQREVAEEASFANEAGHGSAGFRLGYYFNRDGDGDGNPFLDEELTVVEPVVVFDYNVTDRLAVTGKFSYDLVSSASIDRLSNYDEQSGASGDDYIGVSLGAHYKLTPNLRIGGNASYSTEYDYNSFGLGSYVAKDLNDKNTTLKVSVNGFHDVLDIIRFDGTEDSTDDRETASGTFNWYQVINPTLHSELGTTLSYQSGFLEMPYNFVVIEDPAGPLLTAGDPAFIEREVNGSLVPEELPDSRIRGAVFGRLRKYFSTGTSLEIGGRLYTDSWGITSVTLEPRLYQWLVEEVLNLRFRYRFYGQTAADDFHDSFLVVTPSHRTQDADLGDFTAHGVGLKFDWYVREDLRLDLGADYVLRSDGIDQIFASAGVTWDF